MLDLRCESRHFLESLSPEIETGMRRGGQRTKSRENSTKADRSDDESRWRLCTQKYQLSIPRPKRKEKKNTTKNNKRKH